MQPFHEEQRFEWFWTAVVCAPALLVGFGLFVQVFLGRPLVANALLWPAFIVTVVVAVWFSRMKLIAEVRDSGLFIDFIWLWPERTIAWSDIKSIGTRTYRPIRDFGGYGVRWDSRGIVYHARGKQGVRLVLASGERVLVGSQQPAELAQAIAQRTGLPVAAL